MNIENIDRVRELIKELDDIATFSSKSLDFKAVYRIEACKGNGESVISVKVPEKAINDLLYQRRKEIEELLKEM